MQEVAEKRRRLTKDAEPDRVFEATAVGRRGRLSARHTVGDPAICQAAGVFAGAGGAGPSEPAGPEAPCFCALDCLWHCSHFSGGQHPDRGAAQ